MLVTILGVGNGKKDFLFGISSKSDLKRIPRELYFG